MKSRITISMSLVLSVLLVVVTVVPALYFAKAFLMPLVVSSFIALMCSPFINYVESKGIPRTLVVVLVLSCLVGVSLVGFSAMSEPVKQWWSQLPDIVKSVTQEVSEVAKTTEQQTGESLSIAGDMDDMGDSTLFSLLKSLATATPAIVINAMMVLFMVYFMLNHGRGLYRQMVHCLDSFSQQKQVVGLVKALQSDLSRYVSTITLVNVGLGVAVGLVFWILGMTDPFLWGALAGMLNFAPYVGPLISALSFTLVGYLQFDSLSLMLAATSLYLVLNLVESQFVTPTLLGRRFNLNPLVIFVWLSFWGWLWGGIGFLVAVPLLVSVNLLIERVTLVDWPYNEHTRQ